MSARRRFAGAGSLLVVAALLGVVSRQWGFAAVAALAIAGAVAAGARAAPGRGIERLATIAAAGLGAAIALAGAPPAARETLAEAWSATALGALLAAAARLALREPEGGAVITEILALVALTAAGEVRTGRIYAAAVVLHLALALLALRESDAGRPAWPSLPRRAWALAAALVGFAAALSLGLARQLPPLSAWMQRQIVFAVGSGARTGFTDRLWLGSLDGMLESDEVVMRLEGPHADYLRGAVYDRYERGRWTAERPGTARPIDPPPASSEPGAVRITPASGRLDRYFLPLGARAVAPAEGEAEIDRFGLVRSPSRTAGAVSFTPRGDEGAGLAPPGDEDLDVPVELRALLDRVVAEWTAGAAGPEAKIDAIAARLRTEYAYSLTVRHRPRDPVIGFLLEERRGHCEYFASATALLARRAGVPARVVGGYRVAERNPLGGRWIVRERNAHAWVEVFLPGRGWTTVDATPSSELPQDRPHELPLLGALGDLLAGWWADLREGASWGGVARLAGVGAAAFAILALARRLRRGGARPKGGGRAVDERPPASVERLFDALARRGAARAPSEPLERFARRLQQTGHAEPAALVERWAAHRYGGEGDAAPLLAAIDGAAARLRRGA